MDTTDELPSSSSLLDDTNDAELSSLPDLDDKPDEEQVADKSEQPSVNTSLEQVEDKPDEEEQVAHKSQQPSANTSLEQVEDKPEQQLEDKPEQQLDDKPEQQLDDKPEQQLDDVPDEPLEVQFAEYYDLPVKRMVFGDLQFPVLNEIVRIKGNNICLRIIFARPPDGTKPDRRHCLQIQLSFTHIHKFLFLAPETNNGATAIALAISDVAVLRLNGALSAATGEKPSGHPSRRYIFFDLMFNYNNPVDKRYWDEVLRFISREYDMQVHKKLAEEKMVLSDKDYSELEKSLKLGNVGFIKKDTLFELLKFSDMQMEVMKVNDFDYIVFTSTIELQVKAAEKRKESAPIIISDTSIPKLDKNDIIQQESASGRIEFNYNDLALLKPNAWLNDKIVDWYCYHLFKLVPEEKRSRIRLCETYFYTSITKGIENETNPTKLKAGIYSNYDPKKMKHSFFDSDFIVVPIHRLNHWFLVVIVDPKAAICQVNPQQTSEEVPHCHFLIFDSFKKLATNEHDITFDHLTYFLARHYDDVKRDINKPDTFNRALVKKVFPDDMPQQTNADDCGVYSLMFLKYFFDHLPDDNSLPDFSEWWKTFTIQGMRAKINTEIILTATNYEDIKRRHENMAKEQQPPPAKKPKLQIHPTSQIYRISSIPTFRPTGATPIMFRPRTPTSTRPPTAPVSVRAPSTARRGRGAPPGPRKPSATKRAPRKSAAEKAATAASEKSVPPPPSPAPEDPKPQELSASESLKAMGLQASDHESDS